MHIYSNHVNLIPVYAPQINSHIDKQTDTNMSECKQLLWEGRDRINTFCFCRCLFLSLLPSLLSSFLPFLQSPLYLSHFLTCSLSLLQFPLLLSILLFLYNTKLIHSISIAVQFSAQVCFFFLVVVVWLFVSIERLWASWKQTVWHHICKYACFLVPSRVALISHASKFILKILQARLQQYMNKELPDVQGGFRKSRGTRHQTANVCWIIEKARNPRRIYTSASLTAPKPLTVWITTNCGNFFNRWEYQTTLLASCETYMQVKKQQLELDMEQQTGSK